MSDRPDILMRVGAAFDRSFDAVLADAQKKYERAFGSGRGAQQGANQALAVSRDTARQQLAIAKAHAANEITIARDIYRENSRLNRQMLSERSRMERQQAAQAAQLSRQRTQERLKALHDEERMEMAHSRRLLQMAQQAEREKNRVIRNEGRQRYREQLARDREIDRFATRTSHRATRFFFPPPEGALGYMKRIGMDLARGAGVDLTLGGGFHRSVELEKTAQILSQNAYQPGQTGPAGTQVAGTVLSNEARKVASQYGLEGGSQEVVEGMSKFVSVTGDLETARALSADLAKISAATGVGFSDAMEAASAMSVKLGEIPDKAKVIYGLMRGFAWQGKLAAVEISHLSKSMPRLISGVTRFEGDVGENMQKLGVLAQMARGGPAGTAKEAATGVARFADLLVTPTRVKAMQKVGLKKSDIFNDKGLIRDPFEIIKKALEITGGDPLKMRVAFASVMGSRPVERFADIYRGAGGGKAGLAAIDAETKRIMSGSEVGMSDAMVGKLAEQYSGAKVATAKKFQETLDRATSAMADRLFPSLEKAGPIITEFVGLMGELVAWAAENPVKAILAAITASIARAGLESVGRLIIDRVMVSFGGAMLRPGVPLGPGAAGGPGGVVATGVNLGGIGGVATGVAATSGMAVAAYAGFTITTALLDIANAEINKGGEETARSSNSVYQEFAAEYGKANTDEERAAAWKRAKYNLGEIEGSRGIMDRLFGDSDVSGRTLSAMAEIASRHDKAREQRNDREFVSQATGQTPGFNTEIAAVVARELVGALGGQDLNVRVRNVEEFNFETDNGGSHPEAPFRSDWVSR